MEKLIPNYSKDSHQELLKTLSKLNVEKLVKCYYENNLSIKNYNIYNKYVKDDKLLYKVIMNNFINSAYTFIVAMNMKIKYVNVEYDNNVISEDTTKKLKCNYINLVENVTYNIQKERFDIDYGKIFKVICKIMNLSNSEGSEEIIKKIASINN